MAHNCLAHPPRSPFAPFHSQIVAHNYLTVSGDFTSTRSQIHVSRGEIIKLEKKNSLQRSSASDVDWILSNFRRCDAEASLVWVRDY